MATSFAHLKNIYQKRKTPYFQIVEWQEELFKSGGVYIIPNLKGPVFVLLFDTKNNHDLLVVFANKLDEFNQHLPNNYNVPIEIPMGGIVSLLDFGIKKIDPKYLEFDYYNIQYTFELVSNKKLI